MKNLFLSLTLFTSLASTSFAANNIVSINLNISETDTHEHMAAHGYLKYALTEKGYDFDNNQVSNYEVVDVTIQCLDETQDHRACTSPYSNIAIKNMQTGEVSNFEGTAGEEDNYDIGTAFVNAVDTISEL